MFIQDAWIFVSFVNFCEEKLRRAWPILFLAFYQAWKKNLTIYVIVSDKLISDVHVLLTL